MQIMTKKKKIKDQRVHLMVQKMIMVHKVMDSPHKMVLMMIKDSSELNLNIFIQISISIYQKNAYKLLQF